MNESIFREYDIRGIVRTDLTDNVVHNLGRAYGTWMHRRNHRVVAVGYDVRLSSPHLARLFTAGVLSAGINVLNIGQVTTPILYYAIVHLKAHGGVMITGSHNPIEFNGLKICESLAPVYGEQIQELKAIMIKEDFDRLPNGTLEQREIVPDYLKMLKDKFRFDKKLKVVIDAGNGTAGPIAVPLWRELGMEVIPLYCEVDGNFPNHLPDPTVPRFMQDLCRTVVAEKADLGIGYDGDADRVGIVDDKGRLIYADQLMVLLSRDVLSRHPGEYILFDIKCSQLLGDEIKKAGGKPLMWKTGHSLLKAKMKEKHAPFAGEMSGHLFFADQYYGFDDGLYASGRIMQIVAKSDKNLSQMIDALPAFFSTPEIRVECADKIKFQVIENLVDVFQQQYETITLDGARVVFEDGWGLVRASNTQPVLVLRFEAKTQKRLGEIMNLFKIELEKFPDVKFSPEDFSL
ncbi:phosphomannomutase/phosphoglucomutase [candidate division KSB1 bacterium]|nr:phosphomannomutase/phosphoglucomutase [candidate division KSB1 bacterium]